MHPAEPARVSRPTRRRIAGSPRGPEPGGAATAWSAACQQTTTTACLQVQRESTAARPGSAPTPGDRDLLLVRTTSATPYEPAIDTPFPRPATLRLGPRATRILATLQAVAVPLRQESGRDESRFRNHVEWTVMLSGLCADRASPAQGGIAASATQHNRQVRGSTKPRIA